MKLSVGLNSCIGNPEEYSVFESGIGAGMKEFKPLEAIPVLRSSKVEVHEEEEEEQEKEEEEKELR